MKWKDEAMEKLRRYHGMRQAEKNIPEEIDRLKAEACSIRSAATDSVSVKGGGNRREDALINNLAEQQELEWNLQQVKRWLTTTDRGLAALSPDERLILQRMYLFPERGAIDRLCNELGVEQSSIYRRRDQALHRFTVAMYGFLDM